MIDVKFEKFATCCTGNRDNKCLLNYEMVLCEVKTRQMLFLPADQL
jgi:hypothetical protein